MNARPFRHAALVASVLAAAPLAAQITPRPQVERPRITTVVREPALYVYDEYAWDGASRTMHTLDNFTGSGHVREPMPGIQGIGADRRGNVYAAVWVGPSQHSSVVQIRRSGRFEGPLQRATAVATDAQGRIYITDADLGQVIRIDDLTGKNMVAFGSPGSGIGQFRYPQGIAIDRQGHIYVADTGNDRIVRIDDMNGEGWRTYNGAAYGRQGLQVIGVKDIAVDSRGRIYYLRPQNGYVVRIDDISGAGMRSWGGPAPGVGQGYYLVEPSGIAIDEADRIYIVDRRSRFLTRLDDISGAGRAVLHTGPEGDVFRLPTHIAVSYPRADRTPIR
jgi:streptogramin lyase